MYMRNCTIYDIYAATSTTSYLLQVNTKIDLCFLKASDLQRRKPESDGKGIIKSIVFTTLRYSSRFIGQLPLSGQPPVNRISYSRRLTALVSEYGWLHAYYAAHQTTCCEHRPFSGLLYQLISRVYAWS